MKLVGAGLVIRGFIPAWQASRVEPAVVMREDYPRPSPGRRERTGDPPRTLARSR